MELVHPSGMHYNGLEEDEDDEDEEDEEEEEEAMQWGHHGAHSTLVHDDDLVREIGLCYTCWWYSLCNFPYRQHYENTCSYNFDC